MSIRVTYFECIAHTLWRDFPCSKGGWPLGDWRIVLDCMGGEDLGEYLAHHVSGEWRETREGRYAEYRLRQIEPRALQMLPIARGLTRFLLEERLGWWIDRLISRRYRDFSSEESQRVADTCLQWLQQDPNGRRARHDIATTALMGFLIDHDLVVVSGVMNFLWPEIRDELTAMIDRAVDNFFQDREYLDYVSLLKHFVQRSPAVIDEVHAFKQDHTFRLEDATGHPVGAEVLQEMRSGLDREDGMEDDVLVSALFALSPKRVIFHGYRPNGEALKTVEAVFENVVGYCEGCSRCGGQSHYSKH